MISTNKPVFTEDDIWCSNPPGSADLIRPDDTKISAGFRYAEIPKHSTFNWAGNIVSAYIAHINKYGIGEWDNETTYDKGSLVLRGDSTNGREIFIAINSNTNEDPLGGSNPNWRTFFNSISEYKDVNIDTNTLQNGHILQQVLYDEDDDTVPYYRMWENISGIEILKLVELDDTIGAPINGSILFKIDTVNNDKMYAILAPYFLMNYLSFEDYLDVDNNPSNWNRDDVLTFSGGNWTGVPTEGYVEWDNILYKPAYFNPVKTDASTIGGFRTEFSFVNNEPILDLFSDNIKIPLPPKNVTCSTNNANYITITWEAPTSGFSPESYIIFRNNEYLYETADETILLYDDTTAELNKFYTYYIISKNSAGNSLKSNSSIGIRTDILPAPTGFTASDNISTSVIEMNWNTITGALGYNVYKKAQGETNFTYIAGGVQPPYMRTELPNTTAEYYVKAVNANNDESDPSNIDIGKTRARDGNKIFTFNGSFTVPNGVTYIRLDIQGAGGSGAVGDNDGYHSGGGYAGEFKTILEQVNESAILNINIGNGGTPSNFSSLLNGETGESTSVIINYTSGNTKIISASGGKGGLARDNRYTGNGGTRRSNITGLYYKDGLHSYNSRGVSCYGGQASEFGNGGSQSGQIPAYGAGGTAVSLHGTSYDNPSYCIGGDGIVIITWGSDVTTSSTDNNEAIIQIENELDRNFGIYYNLQDKFANEDINDLIKYSEINMKKGKING